MRAIDPFGERQALQYRACYDILGATISVSSNSRALVRLFEAAFGSLPRHSLGAEVTRIEVTLVLAPGGRGRREVPAVKLRAGAGFLSGVIDADNFVILSARERRAFIRVDRGMLDFPYHVRYELLEFALYTLVPRVLRLVPLHGGAVSRQGRAALLFGPSGSGKSTAVMNCALGGLELLSEDAVFLEPHSLHATGCANFLHLRTDGLDTVGDRQLRADFRRAPVIERRSGVRKFELDLRTSRFRLAAQPPRLAALIALSPRTARDARLLQPLRPAHAQAWLRREQPYASARPEWRELCRNLAQLPAYRLLRGRHPEDTADTLQRLLASQRP